MFLGFLVSVVCERTAGTALTVRVRCGGGGYARGSGEGGGGQGGEREVHSGSAVVAVQHGTPDGLEGQEELLALVVHRTGGTWHGVEEGGMAHVEVPDWEGR